MVVVEVAIIAGAFLAGAAAIQHFYDRYAPGGFYRQSRGMALEAQGELLKAVSPVAAEIHGLREDLKGQAAAAEAAFKAMPQLPAEIPPDAMQLARSLGGTMKGANQLTREAKRALGASIIGPYLPLLKTFAAPLADFLEENPDMAMEIMEWPVVKKLINKASQLTAQATGTASQTFETAGWGT